jgi:hypothetical protein
MNFTFMPALFQKPQPEAEEADFNVIGGEIFATFSPWASWLSDGNPFEPAPTTLLPVPATADGSAGALAAPDSVVAVTAGGITINLIYDTAAMNAPQAFRDGIQQAVAIMAAAISDKITVNIKIDYSGTGGGAAAGPDHGVFQSYSSVRANLINHATPGDTTFNALAAGSSIQGQSSVAVWNAQLKLWGLMGANDTTTDDGSATFATDINPNLLVGVALHELTHAMGRIPYGPQPDIFDLFRFTGAGTRLFQGSATAPAAYFSLDGGNSKVADYGRTSDASDFLNSGVQGSNDPFNEFYNGGTSQKLTATDLKQLNALGFHLLTSDTISPSLIHDTSLTVIAGTSATISSSQLQFDDNVSTHGQETYTVVTGPTHGTLLKNGSSTTSFTQADIDNGLIAYRETANVASPDSFAFKVSDAAGNATTTASFRFDVSPAPIFESPVVVLAAFTPGAGNWNTDQTYPRALADVNGDGMADIVGFGDAGVYISLATGGGAFAALQFKLAAFNPAQGWTSDDAFHRELADVNGDGMADIVGFGGAGVYVSLATGGGNFATPEFKLAAFNAANGWTSDDAFHRELADVNGDGMADIVGFGIPGVKVALATGGGNFATPEVKLAAFNPANGWTSQDAFHRELADINGDHMADIVGFGNGGVYVSLATGGGNFAPFRIDIAAFNPAHGWTSNDQFPRELADVNHDGMADIIGFGNGGVYVAAATGGGHFAPVIVDIPAFNPVHGWTSDNVFLREVADVNSDGNADIVGFGPEGVTEALSHGFHLI